MNRWVYFIIWILIICVGAFANEFAPDNFTYLIGFATGTFSSAFLRLFADKNK